jgi:hypothetical protein
MPGEKAPGIYRAKRWWRMPGWREEFSKRLPTQDELRAMSSWPGGGVGTVCGNLFHDVGMDIDTDNAAIVAAILDAIPRSPIAKRGAKGSTWFFRGADIIKSKSWNVIGSDGKKFRACDLLGRGRFTVLPPSRHPDTGQRYAWLTNNTLENTSAGELPELMPKHVDAISSALVQFGYEPELDQVLGGTPGPVSGDDATPHRQLNEMAFANLSAWVPALGLFRCRPARCGGYEAVAVWRASSTGRPDKIRNLNLKIHPTGINDFGNGPEKFTAINLIMRARGCDLDEAFGWLADALGWGGCRIKLKLDQQSSAGSNKCPPTTL